MARVEIGGFRAVAADDAPQSAVGEIKNTRPVPPKLRSTPNLYAEETAAEAQGNEQVRAVRRQAAAMFAAYNARLAPAYADRFLPHAEYETVTEEVLSGRPAIQAHFEKVFATFPQGRSRLLESEFRSVGLHTVIEEGIAGITHTTDDEESAAPYVAIWKLIDGSWSVASLRELPCREQTITPHNHLQELSWMIGDWVDESRESVVVTSCRWSADGNFLIQEFTARAEGTPVVSGVQRIGYDPLTHKFRSWVFDSQGGFGESFWNWDGEKWVVRSSAVRHDGRLAASLNFIVPESKDSYFWQSSHRMSDGDNLPDLSVRVVRHLPPSGAGAPQK